MYPVRCDTALIPNLELDAHVHVDKNKTLEKRSLVCYLGRGKRGTQFICLEIHHMFSMALGSKSEPVLMLSMSDGV